MGLSKKEKNRLKNLLIDNNAVAYNELSNKGKDEYLSRKVETGELDAQDKNVIKQRADLLSKGMLPSAKELTGAWTNRIANDVADDGKLSALNSAMVPIAGFTNSAGKFALDAVNMVGTPIKHLTGGEGNLIDTSILEGNPVTNAIGNVYGTDSATYKTANTFNQLEQTLGQLVSQMLMQGATLGQVNNALIEKGVDPATIKKVVEGVQFGDTALRYANEKALENESVGNSYFGGYLKNLPQAGLQGYIETKLGAGTSAVRKGLGLGESSKLASKIAGTRIVKELEKTGAGRALVNSVKNGWGEGWEEIFQNISEDLYDKVINPKFDNTNKSLEEVVTDALKSGAYGFFGGFVTGIGDSETRIDYDWRNQTEDDLISKGYDKKTARDIANRMNDQREKLLENASKNQNTDWQNIGTNRKVDVEANNDIDVLYEELLDPEIVQEVTAGNDANFVGILQQDLNTANIAQEDIDLLKANYGKENFKDVVSQVYNKYKQGNTEAQTDATSDLKAQSKQYDNVTQPNEENALKGQNIANESTSNEQKQEPQKKKRGRPKKTKDEGLNTILNATSKGENIEVGNNVEPTENQTVPQEQVAEKEEISKENSKKPAKSKDNNAKKQNKSKDKTNAETLVDTTKESETKPKKNNKKVSQNKDANRLDEPEQQSKNLKEMLSTLTDNNMKTQIEETIGELDKKIKEENKNVNKKSKVEETNNFSDKDIEFETRPNEEVKEEKPKKASKPKKETKVEETTPASQVVANVAKTEEGYNNDRIINKYRNDIKKIANDWKNKTKDFDGATLNEILGGKTGRLDSENQEYAEVRNSYRVMQSSILKLQKKIDDRIAKLEGKEVITQNKKTTKQLEQEAMQQDVKDENKGSYFEETKLYDQYHNFYDDENNNIGSKEAKEDIEYILKNNDKKKIKKAIEDIKNDIDELYSDKNISRDSDRLASKENRYRADELVAELYTYEEALKQINDETSTTKNAEQEYKNDKSRPITKEYITQELNSLVENFNKTYEVDKSSTRYLTNLKETTKDMKKGSRLIEDKYNNSDYKITYENGEFTLKQSKGKEVVFEQKYKTINGVANRIEALSKGETKLKHSIFESEHIYNDLDVNEKKASLTDFVKQLGRETRFYVNKNTNDLAFYDTNGGAIWINENAIGKVSKATIMHEALHSIKGKDAEAFNAISNYVLNKAYTEEELANERTRIKDLYNRNNVELKSEDDVDEEIIANFMSNLDDKRVAKLAQEKGNRSWMSKLKDWLVDQYYEVTGKTTKNGYLAKDIRELENTFANALGETSSIGTYDSDIDFDNVKHLFGGENANLSNELLEKLKLAIDMKTNKNEKTLTNFHKLNEKYSNLFYKPNNSKNNYDDFDLFTTDASYNFKDILKSNYNDVLYDKSLKHSIQESDEKIQQYAEKITNPKRNEISSKLADSIDVEAVKLHSISNRKTMTRAKIILNNQKGNNYVEKAKYVADNWESVKQDNKMTLTEMVALEEQVSSVLDKVGDTDTAQKMVQIASNNYSDIARALQMAHKFSKPTYQKIIQGMVNELNKETGAKNQIKLTTKEVNDIAEQFKALDDATDLTNEELIKQLKQGFKEDKTLHGFERSLLGAYLDHQVTQTEYSLNELVSFRKQQIYKNSIISKYKATMGNKIKSYVRINHLLNAKTALKNIISTQSYAKINRVLSDLSGIITNDSSMRTIGGNTKKAINQKALHNLGKQSFEIIAGFAGEGNYKYNDYVTKAGAFSGEGFVNKLFSPFEKMNQISMGATDGFFKSKEADMYIEQMANVLTEQEFIDNYQDILKDAKEYANRVTFNDKNWFSDMFVNAKEGMNKVSKAFLKPLNISGDYGLGDITMMYARTPANVVYAGIQLSPLGYLKAFKEFVDYSKVKKGNNRYQTIKAKNEAKLSFAKANAGSLGLMALGAILRSLGVLSFSGHDDDDKKEKLYQEMGLSGTKLNLSQITRLLGGERTKGEQEGDLLVDGAWVEPLSTTIFAGGLIWEAIYEDTGKAFTSSICNDLISYPCEKTLETFLRSYEYGDSEDDNRLSKAIGSTLVQQLTGSFIPMNSARKQFAQAIDPIQRNIYPSKKNEDGTDKSWWKQQLEYFVNYNKNSSFLLKDKLEARTDTFGDEMQYNTRSKGQRIADAMSPFQFTNVKRRESVDILLDATKGIDITPTMLPKTSAPSKTEYGKANSGVKSGTELTEKQKEAYLEEYNRLYEKYFLKKLKDLDIANKSDATREKFFDSEGNIDETYRSLLRDIKKQAERYAIQNGN